MNESDAPAQSRSARSARFHNYVHRYRNLLRKYWWALPAGLMLGLAGQTARLFLAPPSYVSYGRMIMNIRITTAQGTGTGFTEELSNFLGTQAALMKSAKVLERAFARVRDDRKELIATNVTLSISVSPKTTIFNLQAVGGEPLYTQAYLDACMEEYLALKAEMRTTTSETTLSRIIDQVADLDRKLVKSEEEEAAFKTNNNVVFIKEQVNSIATYLVQKNRQLDSCRTEHRLLTLLTLDQNLERQQQRETTPGDLTSLPANVFSSDYLRARQELQLRKAELKEWSEILRPKHPRMLALTEEIVRRESILRIFQEQSAEQLAHQRESLSLQITNLEREIKDLDVRSLDLSSKLAQYERLVANQQNLQNLRDNLQRAIQSIGVEKEINPDTVTTLDRASPAVSAHGSLVQAYLLAAVLGLLASLGVLLLVDRLDDRPASFTDLQDMFDEPVLGQIPFEPARPAERNGLPLLHPDDDRHAFLEAYRNLRSSLLYMATEGQRPKVLVGTSAIPGDGKSMTTANLAITMALAGARVLLVDADLRKGLLHRRFGVEGGPGLTEVLDGKATSAQAVVSTPTSKLFLLPRGDIARNPGEMFLKSAMRDLIKELAAQFDYVIFDTAPVMAADDVTSLAPHVEGVLFVVRASYTSGRVARAALDLLYQREVNILGLVFNGVQADAGEYYYYRYKDYYANRRT